jgi:hypothetical protein
MKLNVITSNGLQGQAICKLTKLLNTCLTSLIYISVKHSENVRSRFFACLRARHCCFPSGKIGFTFYDHLTKIFHIIQINIHVGGRKKKFSKKY